MLYLFHGEDDFLSSQQLQRQKNNFVTKHGDINLSVYDEDNFVFENLANDLLSSPFLGEKRLVVAENLLGVWKKEDKEKFEKIIPKIADTTIVIFHEIKKTDSRNMLLKYFSKDNIKEFVPMDQPRLRNWIDAQMRESGYQIESKTSFVLANRAGGNTRQIYHEIQKLLAYKFEEKKITAQDVGMIVSEQMNTNIFDFSNALAQKNLTLSEKVLKNISDTGESTFGIMSLISKQFRNLLGLKIAREEKIDQNTIAEKLAIHPYALKKSAEQLHNFSIEKLLQIYHAIAATDLAIKTGEMEESLALDLLVVKICQH
ncbi:DNA polymerase III subunit delta [Candidatus Microgenomates bacterium]|nr:DNA polymerase III subunit delta [Candidatus Microgenomates bacterium]